MVLAQIDTSRLPAETRHLVEEEITAAMAAAPRIRPEGVDLLEYKMVVEDYGLRNEITWLDDGSAAAVSARNLIARIQQAQ